MLDLQQKYQSDPESELGFKKYSVIKELFKKQQEQEKALEKKHKLADSIAGEGTTTVAHSRTEHISEDMFKSRTDFNDIDSPEIRGEIAGEPETPIPGKHSDIDGASALKVHKKKSEIVNLVKVKPTAKDDNQEG